MPCSRRHSSARAAKLLVGTGCSTRAGRRLALLWDKRKPVLGRPSATTSAKMASEPSCEASARCDELLAVPCLDRRRSCEAEAEREREAPNEDAETEVAAV